MSLFSFPISSLDRENMTLPPPPQYTYDGEMVEYTKEFLQRYEDLRLMKRKSPVYIEEQIDEYNFPNSTVNFKMTLRCMRSMADLNIILSAARHLQMIDSYRIDGGYNQAISNIYEREYIYVYYLMSFDNVEVSEGLSRRIPYQIDYQRRRHIWESLFVAAGYVVRWGNAINIKRRNP